MQIMSGNPLALALVVMNLGLLGFVYYAEVQHSNQRQRELELLYTNRREVGELLAHCYPAPLPPPLHP